MLGQFQNLDQINKLFFRDCIVINPQCGKQSFRFLLVGAAFAMETQIKKYEKFFKTADGKQKALEKKNAELTEALEESETESTVKKLQEMRLHSDYERIKGILERIPPDVIRQYTNRSTQKHDINR